MKTAVTRSFTEEKRAPLCGCRNKTNACVKKCLSLFGLRGKAFQSAFYISLPSAGLALTVRLAASSGSLPWFDPDNNDFLSVSPSVWTGITSVLGFLIVFRASQAYGRYWQAMTNVHLMRAEWFDSCSAISSFCSGSSEEPKVEQVRIFKLLLVRLFSLLHAGALLRLMEPDEEGEDMFLRLKLLDPASLDKVSAAAFHKTDHKVELVSQWIQHLICRGVEEKILTAPPPIVSRSFQELANGTVKYHDALKVKTISFPTHYAQVCELLLAMHWLVSPCVFALWVNSPALATTFTFLAVFVLWSLSRVSVTIENPFCLVTFMNDALDMQAELNEQLILILDPLAARIPSLPGMTEATIYDVHQPEYTLTEFINVEHCADERPQSCSQIRKTVGVEAYRAEVEESYPSEKVTVLKEPEPFFFPLQDIPDASLSKELGLPDVHLLEISPQHSSGSRRSGSKSPRKQQQSISSARANGVSPALVGSGLASGVTEHARGGGSLPSSPASLPARSPACPFDGVPNGSSSDHSQEPRKLSVAVNRGACQRHAVQMARRSVSNGQTSADASSNKGSDWHV